MNLESGGSIQLFSKSSSYLDVVTVQATALSNERAALNILGQRLTATVLLVKALGGSWNNDIPAS